MERLGKEAVILTEKEFETIRKYKKIEHLAEIEEENEEENKTYKNMIIGMIAIITIAILFFMIANLCIISEIHTFLENLI